MSGFVIATVPQQAVNVVLKRSWQDLQGRRLNQQPRYSPALSPVHVGGVFKGVLPESSLEWPTPHEDTAVAKRVTVQVAGMTSACVRLPLAYTTGDHVAAGEPVYFDQDELVLGGQGIPRVGKVVEFIDILDPARWPPKSGEPGLDVGHMAHLVIVIRIEDQSLNNVPSDLAGWAQRLDKLIVLLKEYSVENLEESQLNEIRIKFENFKSKNETELNETISSSYANNAPIHHPHPTTYTSLQDIEKNFYKSAILELDVKYVIKKIHEQLVSNRNSLLGPENSAPTNLEGWRQKKLELQKREEQYKKGFHAFFNSSNLLDQNFIKKRAFDYHNNPQLHDFVTSSYAKQKSIIYPKSTLNSISDIETILHLLDILQNDYKYVDFKIDQLEELVPPEGGAPTETDARLSKLQAQKNTSEGLLKAYNEGYTNYTKKLKKPITRNAWIKQRENVLNDTEIKNKAMQDIISSYQNNVNIAIPAIQTSDFPARLSTILQNMVLLQAQQEYLNNEIERITSEISSS